LASATNCNENYLRNLRIPARGPLDFRVGVYAPSGKRRLRGNGRYDASAGGFAGVLDFDLSYCAPTADHVVSDLGSPVGNLDLCARQSAPKRARSDTNYDFNFKYLTNGPVRLPPHLCDRHMPHDSHSGRLETTPRPSLNCSMHSAHVFPRKQRRIFSAWGTSQPKRELVTPTKPQVACDEISTLDSVHRVRCCAFLVLRWRRAGVVAVGMAVVLLDQSPRQAVVRPEPDQPSELRPTVLQTVL
jgi:hypothetical protein